MTLLRRVLGETLRGRRLRQRRTLREVSSAARVSLGYLSEVERGQKEASSELLASICDALDVKLSDLLREVSETMRRSERAAEVARMPGRVILPAPARRPVPAGVGGRPEIDEFDAEFGAEFGEFEAEASDDDPFAGSADGTVTDSVAEPDEELDGVDLAELELEAGGELGDLGEVLFRTELAGPSDGPYGARCLAAVA